MSCTLLNMLKKPERRRSIYFECAVWAFCYLFCVASIVGLCMIGSFEFALVEVSNTATLLVTFYLWLGDLNRHPHQSGAADNPHLEDDQQIHNRNKRHLHDLLMRVTPLGVYWLLVSLYAFCVWAAKWLIVGFIALM